MIEVKNIYYLKLTEDFFKSIKIKYLRKLAGGDTYVIIYLRLLILSLENNGYLSKSEIMQLDESKQNIEFTINYLKSKDLIIKISEGNYYLNEIMKEEK